MRYIFRRSTFIALAFSLVFGVSAQAQVLNQVPQDALMVVKVKNLQETSNKIAALSQQFGLVLINPALANPLNAIQQQTDLKAGLNLTGDAAFVLVNDSAAKPNPAAPSRPQSLFLLPVSDYKAFISNFPDAATDASNITTFTPLNTSEPVHMALWGAYAAISPNRNIVTQKTTGLKIAGLAARELDTKDIALFANFKALRPIILPDLQQSRPQMLAQFDKHIKTAPTTQQKYAPVYKALINLAFNAAERFVQETQATTYGLSFSANGIGSTVLAEFEPGSYLATTFAKVQNTNQPLLTGLPDSKYILYGGMTGNSTLASQIIDDIAAPIIKEFAQIGEDTKPLSDYIQAVKTIQTTAKTQNFGLLAPNGIIGQDGFIQGVTVLNGDSKTILSAYRDAMSSYPKLTDLFNPNPAAKTAFTYTRNAKNIEGISFDQYNMQVTLDPKTPQEMQQAQFMKWMYGPNGINGFIGAPDADHVVAITGGNDALVTKAVGAAKTNSDSLAKQQALQPVLAQLPQNRVAALYVALDNAVMSGVNVARQLGMPMPLQLPDNLPPVGMTLSTEGSAVRCDSYVPSQLIQAIISAGMQMMMQGMQQPPAGGL